MLVGPDGRLAAHGQTHDPLRKAAELVKPEPKRRARVEGGFAAACAGRPGRSSGFPTPARAPSGPGASRVGGTARPRHSVLTGGRTDG